MTTETTHAHTITRVAYETGDLFEGMADTTGVDREASTVRYGRLLTQQLQREYPGAAVVVRLDRTQGANTRTYVECADPDCIDTDAVRADVQETAETVWQDMEGGWIVFEEAEEAK